EVNRESLILHSAKNSLCLEPSIASTRRSGSSSKKNLLDTCQRLPSAETLAARLNARVVEWQTRTFEGRMPKGMGVQVPPRAQSRATHVSRRSQLDLFVSYLLR